MPNLPEQTVSIVDELTKRGFTPQAGERLPFYSLRQGLYEQSGLKGALGEFTGTSAQNLKLLENIQKNNLTPQSLGLAPAVPTVPVVPGATPTMATGVLTTAGLPQPQRMPTAEELGIPKALTAQEVLSQIGTVPGTTAEQVLATPLGGLTYQESQRRAQEALAAGEVSATQKAEQFGTAGLYFSGARISAEGAERARAMSEKMGIDESLTKFIIQQQESGDKETASRIEKIVKDAVGANKEARSEAISALGALGYVVMPSGQIVQKPSEARAEEAATRAEARMSFQEERAFIADEKAARAEARAVDAASRADAAALRADARFEAFLADQEKENKLFLNADFFKSSFGEEELYEKAKDAGQGAGWFASAANKKEAVNKYLDTIMKTVKTYQDAGFTDVDILKLMK